MSGGRVDGRSRVVVVLSRAVEAFVLPLGGLVACGGLLACGGATRADAKVDSSTGAESGREDAAMSDDASRDTGLAPDDAGRAQDVDANPSCADLADAARVAIAPVIQQNLDCRVDGDCTAGPIAMCAVPCAVVTNEAGAATVGAAASRLCEAFTAQGCIGPELPCSAAGPLFCSGAECVSGFDFSLSPLSAALPHGVCSPLLLKYTNGLSVSRAAHAVPITATNGTLYADPMCTTPISGGEVTIPAGATTTMLGFQPSAPGACLFNVAGVSQTRNAG